MRTRKLWKLGPVQIDVEVERYKSDESEASRVWADGEIDDAELAELRARTNDVDQAAGDVDSSPVRDDPGPLRHSLPFLLAAAAAVAAVFYLVTDQLLWALPAGGLVLGFLWGAYRSRGRRVRS